MSSPHNSVILVDEHDNEIGTEEKLKAHELGLLHRAFSVCVLRKQNDAWQILLQQRAHGKYHSGGLWTNTCCSHPRPGEQTLHAAERRLKEEMGITAPLILADSFVYQASLDNNLTEHELDHVFIAITNSDINIILNPDEAIDYHWIDIVHLHQDIKKHPENYTAWLDRVIEIVWSSVIGT
ncbi:MAG: isopentenyl-diphosphate Delta-isomerase [Legionellales bacterium]|nr:isopentenyl-diphosphate Delta-isomerase [Legionellales bacterium]